MYRFSIGSASNLSQSGSFRGTCQAWALPSSSASKSAIEDLIGPDNGKRLAAKARQCHVVVICQIVANDGARDFELATAMSGAEV